MPEGQEIPQEPSQITPDSHLYFQPIRMMVTTGRKDLKVEYVTLVPLGEGEESMDRFKAVDKEGNKINLGQEKRLMAYILLGLTPPPELTKGLSTSSKIKDRKRKEKLRKSGG